MFDEKVSSKDTLPSHTLGIFKHEFGSDGKIKDTWFLRQFSKDEAARKVCLAWLSAPRMQHSHPINQAQDTVAALLFILYEPFEGSKIFLALFDQFKIQEV